jgi:hypothetical protein
MKKLLPFAIACALAWALATRHRDGAHMQESADSDSQQAERFLPDSPATAVRTSFSCDGRTYCSQMISCDEARYFLQHCPNVKMDGDHDGVPCEQQWCAN